LAWQGQEIANDKSIFLKGLKPPHKNLSSIYNRNLLYGAGDNALTIIDYFAAMKTDINHQIEYAMIQNSNRISGWNITEFGTKCDKCKTINTLTLEKGEFKKQL
jgi:hypothetical protein